MDSLYIITPLSINLVIMQRVFPQIIGIIFKCGKYIGGYRLRKRNIADTISFSVFSRFFERDRHGARVIVWKSRRCWERGLGVST